MLILLTPFPRKWHYINNRIFNPTPQAVQKAIQEMGGLEIFVNLLETKDLKCKQGTLSVLLQIVHSVEMRLCLIDLGIVTPLIEMLKHPARDLQVYR